MSDGLRPDQENAEQYRAEREAAREPSGPRLDPPFPYVVETPDPALVEAEGE